MRRFFFFLVFFLFFFFSKVNRDLLLSPQNSLSFKALAQIVIVIPAHKKSMTNEWENNPKAKCSSNFEAGDIISRKTNKQKEN